MSEEETKTEEEKKTKEEIIADVSAMNKESGSFKEAIEAVVLYLKDNL